MSRLDQAAVPQHGNGVADREHLLEEVRDEHDGDAGAGQATDQRQELPCLGVGERCRGLIHDDDLRVAGERPQDLDFLLPGDRQTAGGGEGGQIGEAGLIAQLPKASEAGACVHPAQALTERTHEHVLQHATLAYESQLLRDHGDAARKGLVR